VITLSRFSILPLLAARQSGLSELAVSPDLNRSKVLVALTEAGAIFPEGITLSWEALGEIVGSKHGCFSVEATSGEVRPIRVFSGSTKRYYSLYGTEAGPPTLLISGIPMHRIKNIDPLRSSQAMVTALGRCLGQVLDTATGLGYTALGLARAATKVITVEWDPAAHEICRASPWSDGLFTSPNLETRLGDSFEVVQGFSDGQFSGILHDPPTLALAGQLYSGEFYRRLHRVLQKRGRLFHYIGDPESRTGASTTAGVIKRLKEAGFIKILPAPEAFGVACEK
jgi:uncharacterized protein